MRKLADATSVPFADSATDTAAAAPLPGLAVGNKPAPGQTGPRGVSPRTNYSRVNTGSPQPVDAGVTSQKGAAPDSQNFLPPKIASSEVSMSLSHHNTIQEMIKAAAAGTLDQATIALEAGRQRGVPEAQKTASVGLPSDVPSIPTDYALKLAGACEYMLHELQEKEAFELGTGKGAEQPKVLETTSSNNEFASGNQGQATPAHIPPKNPGTHKPSETPAAPSTSLEDNAAMKHKEQPVKLGSEKKPLGEHEKHYMRRALLTSPVSAAIEAKKGKKLKSFGNALGHGVVHGLVGGAAGTAGGGALGAGIGALKGGKSGALKGALLGARIGSTAGSTVGGLSGAFGRGASEIHGEHSKHKKEASAVSSRLVDWHSRMFKTAEDAINPAQISAGAAVPPETSAAGEAGGAPAGGQPQGPTSLVGSNESAINYTKGTAKAPVKGQLASYLTEPALSSAHDSTLDKAFDHTGQAGVKISSMRAAAAQAVLLKLSGENCAKNPPPKRKLSGGMGSFSAPNVGGVATGAM